MLKLIPSGTSFVKKLMKILIKNFKKEILRKNLAFCQKSFSGQRDTYVALALISLCCILDINIIIPISPN